MNPATAAAAYRVKVGDLLRVRIWTGAQSVEATGDYPVEESGNVYLPRIGAVPVAGLGLEEMRARVRQAAQKVFEVSNAVITPVFPVSVLGSVTGPRTIDAVPGSTIFDAISAAAGFSENADRRAIQLIRGGQRTVFNADTEEGVNLIASTVVESGDRIFVPARRRFNYQPLLFIAQIITLGLSAYGVLR